MKGNLPAGLAPLPVTLVTGFLGAGKTTLINRILRETHPARLGVLVNDFGSVNIDAQLIVGQSEDVIALSNGCVCCSLRSDLHRQLMVLAENQARPQHVLIEASGLSDPASLLSTLLELERYQIVRLDGVIAVVDATVPINEHHPDPALARRQVMAADLVVVSKAERLPQPADPVFEHKRVHAAPPVEALLSVGGAKAPQVEPTEDPHRFWTWRFVATDMLNFKRLVRILRDLPPRVFRAKGWVHAEERSGATLEVHLVGQRVQVRTMAEQTPNSSQLVFIGAGEPLNDELKLRLQRSIVRSSDSTISPIDRHPRL